MAVSIDCTFSFLFPSLCDDAQCIVIRQDAFMIENMVRPCDKAKLIAVKV
jgi:hypothetical protein